MKLQCNGQDIVSINDNQKKVMCHYLPSSEFEADMQRRVQWVIGHKYEQCLKRFRAEWEAKLKAEGAKSIPVNDDEFCALIFARPDYKDRAARDAEEAANLK